MVSGTFSDGLMIILLPQAIAYGKNQKEIIAGKLKGAIQAVTPNGWRIIYSSIPVATFSKNSLCISIGALVATSMFSIARCNSPFDSARVLPHSRVISLAISSLLSSNNCLNLKSGCILFKTGTSFHCQ